MARPSGFANRPVLDSCRRTEALNLFRSGVRARRATPIIATAMREIAALLLGLTDAPFGPEPARMASHFSSRSMRAAEGSDAGDRPRRSARPIAPRAHQDEFLVSIPPPGGRNMLRVAQAFERWPGGF